MSATLEVSKLSRSLPCRVWDETVRYFGHRQGVKTVLSAGSKAINWIHYFHPNFNSSALNNVRQMLYDAKNVVSLTNVPERTMNFSESLSHAGKRPTFTTVSEAVLSGLIVSSFFLSLGAKLLRRAETLCCSWHTFKKLKLFSNIVSLASNGKTSFIKSSQIFNQVKDLNVISFAQNSNVKKHLLFNASINLYKSGSTLGLNMLSIANLIGFRIAPLIFLTLGTGSLAASVLSHYHYQIAIKAESKI